MAVLPKEEEDPGQQSRGPRPPDSPGRGRASPSPGTTGGTTESAKSGSGPSEAYGQGMQKKMDSIAAPHSVINIMHAKGVLRAGCLEGMTCHARAQLFMS